MQTRKIAISPSDNVVQVWVTSVQSMDQMNTLEG